MVLSTHGYRDNNNGWWMQLRKFSSLKTFTIKPLWPEFRWLVLVLCLCVWCGLICLCSSAWREAGHAQVAAARQHANQVDGLARDDMGMTERINLLANWNC